MKKDKFIGYVDESNMDYLQFERIGYFKKTNEIIDSIEECKLYNDVCLNLYN